MDKFLVEHQLLRSEAQDLKRCQLQYFVLSVTGSGALLGLAKAFTDAHAGVVMLAPLAILLPCWLMFFDKATTLTRLVGYIRLLEDIIGEKPGVQPIYTGYENALALFRREETQAPTIPPGPIGFDRLLRLYILRSRHRFWMINWYTFFSLSVTSCIASALWSFGQTDTNYGFYFIIFIMFLFVLLCAGFTTVLVLQLTFEKFSYDYISGFWNSFIPSHNQLP